MFFHRKTALALLFAVLMTACSSQQSPTVSTNISQPTGSPKPTASTEPPKVITSPITGFIASMEDETTDLPDGKMAWVSFWKLCWKDYPEAIEYELETFTGEGSARKLRRQTDTCFRIEIAKGQNEKSKGLFNRELMLASISGQLAYRVRAVLPGNRVTQWSPLMEAGKATSPVSKASTEPRK